MWKHWVYVGRYPQVPVNTSQESGWLKSKPHPPLPCWVLLNKCLLFATKLSVPTVEVKNYLFSLLGYLAKISLWHPTICSQNTRVKAACWFHYQTGGGLPAKTYGSMLLRWSPEILVTRIYNAIIFWSLVTVSIAYWRLLNMKNQKETSLQSCKVHNMSYSSAAVAAVTSVNWQWICSCLLKHPFCISTSPYSENVYFALGAMLWSCRKNEVLVLTERALRAPQQTFLYALGHLNTLNSYVKWMCSISLFKKTQFWSV